MYGVVPAQRMTSAEQRGLAEDGIGRRERYDLAPEVIETSQRAVELFLSESPHALGAGE